MNKFSSFKSASVTNMVSMCGGCYYITSQNRNHFFKVFLKNYKRHELYFSEKPGRRSRLFFDIDSEGSDINVSLAEIRIQLNKFFIVPDSLGFDVVKNNKFHKFHVYPYVKERLTPKERLKIFESKTFNSEEEEEKEYNRIHKMSAKKRIVVEKHILTQFLFKKIPCVDSQASGLRMIGACKKEGRGEGLYIPKGGVTLQNLRSYSILPCPKGYDFQIKLSKNGIKKLNPAPPPPLRGSNTLTGVKISESKVAEFFKEALKIINGDTWKNWSMVLNFASKFRVDPAMVEEWASKFQSYIPGETTSLILKGSPFSEKAHLGWIFKLVENEFYPDSKEYELWKKQHSPYNHHFEMYSLEDPYTIGRYVEEAEIKTDLTPKQAWDFLVEKLSRCARVVNVGNRYYFIKRSQEKPLESDKNDLRITYSGCNLICRDGEEIMKINIFKPLYKDKRLCFHDVRFDPSPKGKDKRLLNLYLGMTGSIGSPSQAPTRDHCEPQALRVILDHIFKVLAGGDERQYEWILNWLANIVQRPWVKTRCGLILYSEYKQVGKGVFANFLMRHVFGNHLTCKTEDISALTQRFNSILENKLLCWVDEVGGQAKTWRNDWDKLKSYITEENINIEKKYHNSTTRKNYTNFLMLTNHLHYISVEQNDKRYVVIECSPEYQGDTEYFNRLCEKLGQQGGVDFYNYLLEYPIKPVHSFDTKCKKEMMDSSIPPSNRFIRTMEAFEFLSCKDLYRNFKDYCEENGFKSVSSAVFFKQVSGEDRLTSKKSKDRRTAGYEISPLSRKRSQ